MADPNAAINFVEYMKGVGDAVGNMAKEGAYGVYDFGQVVVGGSKILAKEGLGALGAKDAAAAITIEDIKPLSALGKVAVQDGYEGLGNALKSMPANVANAVTDAAGKGDMRALGSAVTDAVFLAEGARAGAVGAVKGAAKGVNALKSLATSEAKAVPKVVPTATPKPRAKPKAWGARKNAKKAKNPKTSNKACPSCDKRKNVKAREKQQKNYAKESPKETTASSNQEKISSIREKIGADIKNHPLRQSYENEVAGLEKKSQNMTETGKPKNEIANELWKDRRELGMKYKDLTPQPLRDYIYEVNSGRYGDPLGPKFEDLVSKQLESGKTLDEAYDKIIKSSSTSNSDINTLLAKFEEWLQKKDTSYIDAALKSF
ncbi:hypothetical protein [Undibacterium sp. Ren11W]|uniref:hypothetical protein n=1 Tax=Undibacterium sp. Ren11W TaxID=3413045 RepID=UPI003BF2C836